VLLLRMAPWWRGPALLLRRAGVALALAAAALVATLPAGAVTPFLASSRSATLHHQITADCPTSVGLNVAAPLTFAPSLDSSGAPVTSPSSFAEQQRRITASAGSVAGLGTGIETVTGLMVATGGQRTDEFRVLAMSRPGFADHITPLAPPQGTGVWIPQTYAEAVGLRVGDTLTLKAATPSPGYLTPGYQPATGSARVAAIYRDLRTEAPTPWWCGVRPLFDPPVEAEGGTPPLVLFDDPAALLSAASTTWATRFTHYAQYPLADPALSIGTAHQISAGLTSAISDLHGQSLLGAAQVTSDLVTFIKRAELAHDGMLPTVLPVTGVGVLVGLLVVAAAALFWVQRRRRELTILSAHGVGARALGVKAVLEAFPALLVGAAAGWGLAWTLVSRAGPDPVLDARSRLDSVLLAVAALAASALVVGVVAALACRSLTDTVRARHRTVLAALPWELALLAAAYPLWQALGGATETSTRDSGGGVVAHVPGRLLVVPILLVAGLAALAARLAVRWLRRQARRRSPAAVGAYLGWRRLGRQALGSALLGAAVAVPIALAAYGAAVTGSVRATIEGEARLRNGSDVVITLTQPVPLPSAFAGHGTELLRLDGTLLGGVSTNLLAVDPDTFAQGAFWTGSVDGESMGSLLGALRDGSVDVLAAAPVPAGPQSAKYAGLDILGGSPTVRQLPALPVSGAYPSAIVLRQDLDAQAAKSGVPQIWVRGDPAKIHEQAVAAGLPIARVTVAGDLYANTVWEPLTYSFTYLTALSLLTGVVTVVGLLLYLEAQAPVHRRAYVLLRRMGLRPRSHRRALIGEIGYPMVAGLIFGVTVAGVLTWVLRADIEMNPTVPPATIVAWPFAPVGLIALAVLLAMAGATAYAHRRISRARPTEVLRDTLG
jgi:putative ABC transport system permease protein